MRSPMRRSPVTAVTVALAALAALGGPVAVVPAHAASVAAASVAAASWTARVLPAGAATSEPRFLLESGVVVGQDYATEAYGQARPWIWSSPTGRRYLGLDGAAWAEVADAKSLAGVVGTLRYQNGNTYSSKAVRWVGTRPVPLLPGATGSTETDAGSPRGSVVVREFTANGADVWLLTPGREPEKLDFLLGREWATSLNDSLQMTVASAGPGTIRPLSLAVWDDGVRTTLAAGIGAWPPCSTDITESGVVVGSQYVITGGPLGHESRLWRDGVSTLLPGEGMRAEVACTADGVNEAGHAVGRLERPGLLPGEPDPGPSRAVMWQDGAVRTLFADTASRMLRPVGVTDRDVVVAAVGDPAVGWNGAAVLVGGAWVDLPVPAGLANVVPIEVNERNQVLGSGLRTAADGTTQRVPILWSQSST